jgi:plasmid stabilization system protein ParE
MGLILHPAAQREYDEAIAWYEEDYPGRGRRFREAVRGEIARIRAEGAHTFPRWRRTTFRAVVVPRFPYTLIFREEPTCVMIYAVAHHKRRPGYWRKRLQG